MQPAQDLFQAYRQAQDLLGAGELRKSADLCKQILDQDPHFAHGYHLMSSLFRATGDYLKAREFAEKAIAYLPTEAVFHLHQGQVLFAMSKWAEAALAFKKANELEPHNPLALLLTADCLTQQGKYDEALATFKRVRALQDIPEVDEHEGLCLMMKGDVVLAEMLFDRVIARRPNYDWGYIHKAKLCMSGGQLDEAYNCFMRALDNNPNSQEAQMGLAQIQQRRQLLDMPAASTAQH